MARSYTDQSKHVGRGRGAKAPLFVLFAALTFCAATLANAPQAAHAAEVPCEIDPATGHGYYAVAVDVGINWYGANAAAALLTCGGVSGHLATITSPAEQAFIASKFPTAVNGGIAGPAPSFGYWIGGKWNAISGNFEWVTGEPFGPYTNWNAGEPSGDVDGAIHFWGFNSGGVWNDAEAGIWPFSGYVVEFPPVTESPMPVAQSDCMKGGWERYGVFKNQGDCVSFVATKGKNQPARR